MKKKSNENQALISEIQSIDEITEMPEQEQDSNKTAIHNGDFGVEKTAVDSEFIDKIPYKKNKIKEAIKKQYERYKLLPTPIRYFTALVPVILATGFLCLVSGIHRIAGGVMIGWSVLYGVGLDLLAKKYKKKKVELEAMRDNPIIVEGNVFSRDNSGHSITNTSSGALEARLLNIQPQPLEPLSVLFPNNDISRLDSGLKSNNTRG